MAISAVSSIQAGGIASLFRGPSVNPIGAAGRAGSVPRIEAVAALRGREEAGAEEAGKPEAGPADRGESRDDPRRSTLAALDPRRADSILAPSAARAESILSRAEARRSDAAQAVSELQARSAERLELKRLEGRRDEAEAVAGKPRERLEELLGRRSAIEARQAQSRGQRDAETASVVSQLRSRDAEVRSHEAAHMAAGGRFVTGGASYTYQKGPDGGQYAVGGEVGIDTSPVPGKPEETVQKMRTIRAAALAPSDPSGADLAVAAAAAQAEAAALADIAQARSEEQAKRYGSEAGAGGFPGKAVDIAA
jgi:hypothetical protein